MTAEFGPLRQRIARLLQRTHRIHVKHQSDFFQRGVTTLPKLVEEIKASDIVVHVIGSLEGWRPESSDVTCFLESEPGFLQRFRDLDPTKLSATQWEAWLAIYFGKRLCGYEVASAEPPDSSQQLHSQQLRNIGHHPTQVAGSEQLFDEIIGSLITLGVLTDKERNDFRKSHIGIGVIVTLLFTVVVGSFYRTRLTDEVVDESDFYASQPEVPAYHPPLSMELGADCEPLKFQYIDPANSSSLSNDLPPFFICETELNALQFRRFIKQIDIAWDGTTETNLEPAQPISTKLAKRFCDWTNNVQNNTKLRLPREAEWLFVKDCLQSHGSKLPSIDPEKPQKGIESMRSLSTQVSIPTEKAPNEFVWFVNAANKDEPIVTETPKNESMAFRPCAEVARNVTITVRNKSSQAIRVYAYALETVIAQRSQYIAAGQEGSVQKMPTGWVFVGVKPHEDAKVFPVGVRYFGFGNYVTMEVDCKFGDWDAQLLQYPQLKPQ